MGAVKLNEGLALVNAGATLGLAILGARQEWLGFVIVCVVLSILFLHIARMEAR